MMGFASMRFGGEAYVNHVNECYGGSVSYGLRPVFTLKSGIKITGGDGTSEGTAYTLGV